VVAVGAGLVLPAVGGAVLGAGVVVGVAELANVARLRPAICFGIAGIAAAVVVAFVEGVADVSLPAVVGGAALGALLSAWWRYAEHVIVVEGPHTALPAIAARFWLPARDLSLALSGRPLTEPTPVLPAARRR
ncbi:MAG TPA: hypothetical protein VGF99_18770, partial [Myxococcota bacterium]